MLRPRTATSFFSPPRLHNTFDQRSRTPNSRHNYRTSSSIWSPLFFSAESRLFAAIVVPMSGRNIATRCWKSVETGLSQRKGARLREGTSLSPVPFFQKSAVWDVQPHLLQGSTCQIALLANPHAGGNASRWLSHRGVTSLRHTHATSPVNDESDPQLQGSSALICTHLRAHMDAARIPSKGSDPLGRR
jgi:hypothetical protein